MEEVPGENFTQDINNEYHKNVDESGKVEVDVTPEIWGRMWSSELKTKKALKSGWLDVSIKVIRL